MNQKQLPNTNFRIASGVFAFGDTGPPDDEQLMTCKGLQKEGFAGSEAFLAPPRAYAIRPYILLS